MKRQTKKQTKIEFAGQAYSKTAFGKICKKVMGIMTRALGVGSETCNIMNHTTLGWMTKEIVAEICGIFGVDSKGSKKVLIQRLMGDFHSLILSH